MGCCNSTPSDTTAAADSSNNTSNPARIPSTTPAATSTGTTSATNNPVATDVPNQRIRAPSPLPKSPKDVSTAQPPWTRSHLDRQREIFFETRVGGNEEVWGAIRLISESLRRGDVQEAQGIIDAAHLTVPTGRVAKGRSQRTRNLEGHRIRGGVFDERGKRYDVPEWVVTDPADIVEDSDTLATGGAATGEKEIEEASDTASSRPTSQVDAAGGKGKGRAEDVGELVSLRVRLSDMGTDTMLQVGRNEKVRAVLEKLRQQTGVLQCKLVMMGKCMEEGATLEEAGWSDGKTVQAFVMKRE